MNAMLNALMGVKGAQIVSIAVVVPQEIVKGGRISKKNPRYPNEMANHAIIKAYNLNVGLNWDYSRVVANRATESISDRTEKSERQSEIKDKIEAPYGKEWKKYPLILNKIGEDSKEYLRTYLIKGNAPRNLTYFVDGRTATPDEVAEIERTRVRSKESAKQADFGLVGDEQVTPKDYTLSNIVAITIDGVRIFNDNINTLSEDIQKYFFKESEKIAL